MLLHHSSVPITQSRKPRLHTSHRTCPHACQHLDKKHYSIGCVTIGCTQAYHQTPQRAGMCVINCMAAQHWCASLSVSLPATQRRAKDQQTLVKQFCISQVEWHIALEPQAQRPAQSMQDNNFILQSWWQLCKALLHNFTVQAFA